MPKNQMMSLLSIFVIISTYPLLPSPFVLVSCQVAEENTIHYFREEWLRMSHNNTRRVFNFGIGSLTSWGGRQHTEENRTFSSKIPSLLSHSYIGRVYGIRRNFGYCDRYTAVTSYFCEDKCPNSVLGVFFEMTEDEYPMLRSREVSYNHIPVAPLLPLPREIDDPNAYYFAWGSNDNKNANKNYNCDNNKEKKIISQAYWDYIIGGLMAWDGRLLDTNRYTWSLDAELELGSQEISKIVHAPPSVSLEERRKTAVELIASTEKILDGYEWIDDRHCPYTYNSIITPSKLLYYNFTEDYFFGGLPSALGTVSPIASKTFYEYVDAILMEGGWGSLNRTKNPCSSIKFNRQNDNNGDGWEPNPYYNDIQKWYEQNSLQFTSFSV